MENATVSLRAQNANADLIAEDLRRRLGAQKFNAWFGRGASISMPQGVLKVCAPNYFVSNWIESHFYEELRLACREAGGTGEVSIYVDSSAAPPANKSRLDGQARLVSAAGAASRPAHSRAALRYRLEDFVVGESNKLAYSAACAIADGEGPFSHLFVHGPCGVGKTHLLQGVCNRASARRLAWRYVTGEQFTNEFIASVRSRGGDEFRNRYRRLDLLVIDDVHFLASKKATQDEFLHTFNAIQSAGKRIVLASDAHPRLVGDMNEQLVSRFIAGMVVKVETPDNNLRLEILRRRAAAMKIAPSPDVLAYIASNVRGSVRELEGSLLKLAAVASLGDAPMTVKLASEALADSISRNTGTHSLDDVESSVGAFFGITPADLHSSRRTRLVSLARMLAAFLARRRTSMSFPEIARHMGKNHSSIILAVQKMEQLLARNEEVSWSTPMGAKRMRAGQLVELLGAQLD